MPTPAINKYSPFQYALKSAAILGGAEILLHLVSFLTHQLENIYVGLIVWVVFVAIVFFLVKNFRNIYSGGYIAFGTAFSLSLQIFIYAGIIYAVYDFIFHHYISPETNELILQHAQEKLIAQGKTDEEIERSMKIARTFNKPAIQFANALFSSIVVGAVLSLIVAAISKKESGELPAEE